MQFVLNLESEGLSQVFFIFLYDDIIVLIFGFIEVALKLERLNIPFALLLQCLILASSRSRLPYGVA